MSRLLPNRAVPSQTERDPTLLVLDDERADEIFDALGSKTARTVLQSLHDDPKPASEVTDEVETTLQNVQYHLTKLEAADLVTVVDTWYGQNGSEMDVYAPTDEALVLFAGEDPESSLRTLLEGLVSAFAVLALGALAIVFGYDHVATGDSATRLQPSVNASGDYLVAVEPAAPDPLFLATLFIAGGVFALGALLAVLRFRGAWS